jgi:hypothetical protein
MIFVQAIIPLSGRRPGLDFPQPEMHPVSLLPWCGVNRDEPAKEAPSLFVRRAIRGFAAVGVPMDITCWVKTVQIAVPLPPPSD